MPSPPLSTADRSADAVECVPAEPSISSETSMRRPSKPERDAMKRGSTFGVTGTLPRGAFRFLYRFIKATPEIDRTRFLCRWAARWQKADRESACAPPCALPSYGPPLRSVFSPSWVDHARLATHCSADGLPLRRLCAPKIARPRVRVPARRRRARPRQLTDASHAKGGESETTRRGQWWRRRILEHALPPARRGPAAALAGPALA
eukprot:scaffold22139_cov146-Isochrysis_galbana.AAC.6